MTELELDTLELDLDDHSIVLENVTINDIGDNPYLTFKGMYLVKNDVQFRAGDAMGGLKHIFEFYKEQFNELAEEAYKDEIDYHAVVKEEQRLGL